MGISIMVMARVAVWSKRAFRQPGIAKWQAFNVDEEHIFYVREFMKWAGFSYVTNPGMCTDAITRAWQRVLLHEVRSGLRTWGSDTRPDGRQHCVLLPEGGVRGRRSQRLRIPQQAAGNDQLDHLCAVCCCFKGDLKPKQVE